MSTAQKNIAEIDLADYRPRKPIVNFDMKQCLFQGLIVREKEIRAFVKEFDWAAYEGMYVSIIVPEDAIIPLWAKMLITSHLSEYALGVFHGDKEDYRTHLFLDTIAKLDTKPFEGERVVVRGCGQIPIPDEAFVAIAERLAPIAKSISYGEVCSMVPIYRSRKK